MRTIADSLHALRVFRGMQSDLEDCCLDEESGLTVEDLDNAIEALSFISAPESVANP